MQEIILATMFWEQVHTALLCSLLTIVTGLYISILPWRDEELVQCTESFTHFFTDKFRPLLRRSTQSLE